MKKKIHEKFLNIKKSKVIGYALFVFFTPMYLLAATNDSKSSSNNPKTTTVTPSKIEKKLIQNLSEKEIDALKKDAQSIKNKWEIRKSQYLSEATLKRHLRAQQYLTSKKFEGAIQILKKIVERSSSTKYEVAKTKVLISKAYSAEEKHDLAELNVKEALDLDQLSYNESYEALLQLAQIQMVSKNYLESKKNVIKYIEIAPESAVPLVMLAAVNFQLEDYEGAQESIDKALKLSKKPQEPWIYLAANIHSKNKNFKTAEKHFRNLVEFRQGNKSYWMGLVAVLFEQEKTFEALTQYEMAVKLGHVKNESEILTRIGLLQAAEVPFKAASELQKALKEEKVKEQKSTYESLAGYWFASKDFDKAVEAYEKASQFSKDGKVDLMLGQVYLEMERWSNAKKSFSLALKKGNLKRQAGQAFMGLGLAAFFSEDKDKAIQYFSKAKDFKNHKETAEKWIGFLN